MKVLIAGGGLAAQRCAEALRRRGHDGPLTMVSAEEHLPYDRPPLSKEVLAGVRDPASLPFRNAGWYRDQAVDLHLGVRAESIDVGRRRLLTAAGELAFDRLLIATGARAHMLPFLEGFENAHVLRDLPDAVALRQSLQPGTRVVIVGAGFVGLEVASTARALGAEVTVLEAAPTPLAAVLGERIGSWFGRLHHHAGVNVMTGAAVTRVHGTGRISALELADGQRVEADTVLVAVGARADTRWLAATGLPGDGIPTGTAGETAIPGVFAAGDAARPVDPVSGALRRQEHWEAAARGGAQAARGILGQAAAPEAPAGFWSDQHGVRIQLVGEPAAADRLVFDGDVESADFAATWHRGPAAAAVLLVGRPHELPDARRLIAGPREPERNAA